MKFIPAISAIANLYDVFFIDQFGVIHDGKKVYDGVIDALTFLNSAQKDVFFISNSGKRSEYNIERNEKIGIPRNLYNGVISSGEVFYRLLMNETQKHVQFNGNKLFHISRDEHPLDTGSRFHSVNHIEDADFIVISGLPDGHDNQLKFTEALKIGLNKQLPLICINPDKVMIAGNQLFPGAGDLANKYENAGGSVVYIGKPFPLIYRMMLEEITSKKILCIGDSIEHDIAGASQVDLPSMFIRNGIYKNELLHLSESQIEAFVFEKCRKYGCLMPDFYTHQFS